MEDLTMFKFFIGLVVIIAAVMISVFKYVMTDESESLTTSQRMILHNIKLLEERYGSFKACWYATHFLKKLEYLISKFDKGRINSSILKERLEKIYNKLNAANPQSEFFGDLAFEFANKYNLLAKPKKEEPKYNFGYSRNYALAV